TRPCEHDISALTGEMRAVDIGVGRRQIRGDGVDADLWHLRAARIVEVDDQLAILLQAEGGKGGAYRGEIEEIGGSCRGGGGRDGVENGSHPSCCGVVCSCTPV